MTETRCSYRGDREQTLMAYLYDDITPIERSMFESHLAGCERCSEELDELRGVRAQLTEWRPPKPAFAFSTSARRGGAAWTTLREIPAWAQVAAAMLLIGVSAGIANLHVHYGSDGLTVRTGWAKQPVTQGLSPAASPWRADLETLERQLRTDITDMRSSVDAIRTSSRPAATTTVRDDEVMRRVRDMIAASERRQERDLALGVANVVRDVNASRAGDLARIEHTLGALQTTTGAELMKQRQQMVNYLTQVSLRR
jgi:Putative zinc-finger